jgi:wyosine [tRNA(Phe)-imidazoG37] synthetase (radical SAM superfamily)
MRPPSNKPSPAPVANVRSSSNHIPDDLCYGPVVSRRFGRSLGVSFSPSNVWACQWHCPYCQQGHLPRKPSAFAESEAILRAVAHGIEHHAHAIDVVCIAGGGEPSDHPEFAMLSREISRIASAYRIRCILLSNADGLNTTGALASLAGYDRVYIKWDPGTAHGGWRSSQKHKADDRRHLLKSITPLRIQSLLFAGRAGSTASGNANAKDRVAWLAAMRELNPVEIHLTTVDRDPRLPSVQAITAAELEHWRDETIATLSIPVSIFPARTPART